MHDAGHADHRRPRPLAAQLQGKDGLEVEGAVEEEANAVGGNGLAFFVGNEVYDHLEKVVDRFDDVANVMHGIVIEHV